MERQLNPLTDQVIALGVVPRFVELLEENRKDTANDAAWALSRMASRPDGALCVLGYCCS